MLTVTREKLYFHVGKARYQYVVHFEGENIAQGETKEAAIAAAKQVLKNALACVGNMPVVSVAVDGTPISTREYAPGFAETVYHRRLEGGNSSCLGKLEIDGKRCSVVEYHKYFMEQYNTANGAE